MHPRESDRDASLPTLAADALVGKENESTWAHVMRQEDYRVGIVPDAIDSIQTTPRRQGEKYHRRRMPPSPKTQRRP